MDLSIKDINNALGEHRDLLDIFDSLRSQGVSHYIVLPEIIVCGDQSAGKSSALEAISGMSLRTKDGLLNTLVVGDQFIEQCGPREGIAKLLTEDIPEAVHVITQLIVQDITPAYISEGLLKLLRREIEKLRIEMDAHVDALLTSASQHTITYNTDLTNNVQRTQQARQKRVMKNAIRLTFGSTRFDKPDNKISTSSIELVKLMGDAFEFNVERFGNALAVDYMEAYYKVAWKRFIDDVGTLAIEDCLISKLSTIFGSGNIPKISPDNLSRLEGETLN